jgi:hypothetical protein
VLGRGVTGIGSGLFSSLTCPSGNGGETGTRVLEGGAPLFGSTGPFRSTESKPTESSGGGEPRTTSPFTFTHGGGALLSTAPAPGGTAADKDGTGGKAAGSRFEFHDSDSDDSIL